MQQKCRKSTEYNNDWIDCDRKVYMLVSKIPLKDRNITSCEILYKTPVASLAMKYMRWYFRLMNNDKVWLMEFVKCKMKDQSED